MLLFAYEFCAIGRRKSWTSIWRSGRGSLTVTAWKDYQNEVAAFFRGLGLDAQTDARVPGVRTQHYVDVLVRSNRVGLGVTWLVECKHWQRRVSKLHLIALQAIVADTGADRGILLSERGFQKGVFEAAGRTNLNATSLADLRKGASAEIAAMRLRNLNDRTIACKRRYWEIPKEERIKRGLRPDVGAPGYSGTTVIDCAEELVANALRGVFPFECESMGAYALFGGARSITSVDEVLAALEPILTELEGLLAANS